MSGAASSVLPIRAYVLSIASLFAGGAAVHALYRPDLSIPTPPTRA